MGAQCIETKCASDEMSAVGSLTVGVDCSKAACQTECKCALDKCADNINTCLADETCAKGQSCALACPCGDKACALKCAVANPSAKALPVAQCIETNCPSATEILV